MERLGVALCGSVVTKMGHLWREKGVDYGIDGEIELVHDGRAMNRVLWVQSKAKGDSVPFTGENDHAFRFSCDPDDIDYWLSGTAPVLLVCSHPESELAWFKHLPTWFADPRRRRERVVEFDKVNDRFDVDAAARLFDLGVDKSAGAYLRPVPVQETLTTNLLRVEHVASHVNVAPTSCRAWEDVNLRMARAGYDTFGDAVLSDGKIYTFRPLDVPPLSVCADGPAERMTTDELSDSDDENDRALLIQLLNKTLKEIVYKDLRFHRERRLYYFKPGRDGKDKRIYALSRSGRAVVKRIESPEGATWQGYTRHMALECQFVYLDGQWFLALVPTYHYTSDGREDFPFAASQLSGLKRIEGHEAVRGQTTFWARYLESKRDLFSGPEDNRLRFGQLERVNVDRGIDDRSWKPAPEELEPEPPNDDEVPLTLFDEQGGS